MDENQVRPDPTATQLDRNLKFMLLGQSISLIGSIMFLISLIMCLVIAALIFFAL